MASEQCAGWRTVRWDHARPEYGKLGRRPPDHSLPSRRQWRAQRRVGDQPQLLLERLSQLPSRRVHAVTRHFDRQDEADPSCVDGLRGRIAPLRASACARQNDRVTRARRVRSLARR